MGEDVTEATCVSNDELALLVRDALDGLQLRAEQSAHERIAEREEAQRERFEKEHIHFEAYEASLLPEAKEALRQKAKYLRAHPEVSVIVEGHCDERGTRRANLDLGGRRAQTVKDYLVQLGIEPERLRTISYGRERPLKRGHGEESWAANRRVQLVIPIDELPADLP
jgi:peptidoglycan-associated lipoprotein